MILPKVEQRAFRAVLMVGGLDLHLRVVTISGLAIYFWIRG